MEGAKTQRRRKPAFLRTEWNKKPRLRSSKNSKWRRARGRHSKIRQKMKGNSKSPNIGYGMPREIRGLVQGMSPKMIQNISDLDQVRNHEIAVISSTLGMKKKMHLAEKASKMKISFLNFKPQEFLSESRKIMDEKKNKGSSQPQPAEKEAKKGESR